MQSMRRSKYSSRISVYAVSLYSIILHFFLASLLNINKVLYYLCREYFCPMCQVYSLICRLSTGSLFLLVGSVANAQAPTITSVSPGANARAAARTGTVAVTFSQPLTAASTGALKVFSSQRGGLRTRGNTQATVSGSVLGFVPTTYAFAPGEVVNLTVTTAAATSGGMLTRPRVSQFMAAVGGTGTGVFNGSGSTAVVTYPNRVLPCDVDGDGDLDFVAVNYTTGASPGTVSVRLNGGNATGSSTGVFVGSQNVAVGINPSDAALGDVDSDGDIDMVVVNYGTSTVNVLLNNGSGTFSAGQTLTVGTYANRVTLGDVDGDGDLDMLVTNSGIASNSGVVNVRLNSGGTFSGSQIVAVGDSPGTAQLGDVDNDGDLDLLVANYSNASVSVRLNGGDATGSNTGLFASGATVAVGSHPYDLTLGDIDGDSDVDLLTSSAEGTTVSVCLNAGTGTFGSNQTILVGNNPRGLVLGDVDADGDLDMLVANTDDNTVSLRLNGGNNAGGGNGTFSGGGELAAGDTPVGLALGDVDGDGDLDLLATNYTNNGTVSVRLNRPTGAPTINSFTPTSGVVGTSVTITGTGLSGVNSVNFNGAAQTTIMANTAASVTVAVPTGASSGPITVATAGGTGTSSNRFQVVPALSSVSPASGPAGGLIALSGSGLTGATRITFTGGAAVNSGFTVNATGTQITGITVPGGSTSGPVTVTTPGGTSNGVVFTVTVLAPQLTSISPFSGPAGSTISLLGTGLTNASTITFAGTANNTVTAGFTVPTAGTITGVVVPAGAVTGNVTVTTPGGTSNGLPFTVTQDLIITSVVPHANATAGTTAGPVQVTFNQPLAATSAGALRVFASQRGGLRTRNQAAAVSGNQLSFSATPAFLPGELISYTVGRSASSSTSSLVRPRVGSFVVAAGGAGRGVFTGSQSLAAGPLPTTVAVGDVDGDGDLDFVQGGNSSGGGVGVYLNGGNAMGSNTGVFTAGTYITTADSPQVVSLADVDGDGDLDLLAASFANSSGSTPLSVVSIRLNGSNATGSNTGIFGGGSDVPINDGPLGLAVGDVDGDGDLDFVTANYGVGFGGYGTGSTVNVRLNNGSGTFSAGQTVSVGLGARSVALGDLDDDGDLDLVAANANANSVSVRLNGGDATGSNTGVFSGTTTVGVGTNPSSITLGDVDGDGDLDLLSANRTSPGTVSVRLNGGLGYFSGGSEVSVYSEPSQVVLGDVDADGDLDLLTADYQAGGGRTVSVRLNGGDATGSGTGTFSNGSNPIVTNGSGSPTGIALGDVDGDGDLDLLSANQFDRSVSVRLNRTSTEPTITNFSPTGGLVGTTVTITGTNLSGATAVSFGGTGQPIITNSSATGLTVTVPPGAITGPLTVTTPAGVALSTSPFTVYPTPVLTSISPASGPRGSTITLNGTGLQYVYGASFAGTSNNTVFSGLTVNATGTQVTGVVVPSGAVTGMLTAVSPLATSNGLVFTVTPPPLTLQQNGTTYASASTYAYSQQVVGTTTTAIFTLTNSGATDIALTNVGATGDFVLSGAAPTSVPAGGTLTLSVAFTPSSSGYRSGTLAFTSALGTYYILLTGTGTYAAPTISSVSPGSGAVGTTVTITGTGFVASNTALTLNGVTVSGVVVGTGGTSLIFTVPTGATAGSVVVTTPGGSATAASPFCVLYTPITTAATRCGSGSLTLIASGAPAGGAYAWYGAGSGGAALGSGPSFTTGSLAATTVYYVAISTGSGSGGCEGTRVPVTATVTPQPVVSVTTSGPTTFCQGGSVTLTASGATAYAWSTGQATASITVSAGGTYSVIGSASTGCLSVPVSTSVVVQPAPARPTITQGGGGQLSSSSATGNQWYLNGVAIVGATAAMYVPTSSGSYTVVVTSAAGCASLPSTPQGVAITATLSPALARQVLLFPNPAQQTCTLQLPVLAGATTAEVRLVNALGQVVQQYAVALPTRLTLNVQGLARGVYTVLLKTSSGTYAKRLLLD
jgi:hypothetical protein